MDSTFYEEQSPTLAQPTIPHTPHVHTLPPPPHSSPLKILFIIFGIVFIMITSAGGGYLLATKQAGYVPKTNEKKLVVSPTPLAVTPAVVEEKLYSSSDSADAKWKVYTHSGEGYQITYPSSWTIGDHYFSPPGVTQGYGNSAVAIRFSDMRIGSGSGMLLEEYAKERAGYETSPARTPKVVTSVTTTEGVVGYTIEWEKMPGGEALGKFYTTIFAKPMDENMLLEIEGGEKYLPEYTEMIKSLTFTSE